MASDRETAVRLTRATAERAETALRDYADAVRAHSGFDPGAAYDTAADEVKAAFSAPADAMTPTDALTPQQVERVMRVVGDKLNYTTLGPMDKLEVAKWIRQALNRPAHSTSDANTGEEGEHG